MPSPKSPEPAPNPNAAVMPERVPKPKKIRVERFVLPKVLVSGVSKKQATADLVAAFASAWGTNKNILMRLRKCAAQAVCVGETVS